MALTSETFRELARQRAWIDRNLRELDAKLLAHHQQLVHDLDASSWMAVERRRLSALDAHLDRELAQWAKASAASTHATTAKMVQEAQPHIRGLAESQVPLGLQWNRVDQGAINAINQRTAGQVESAYRSFTPQVKTEVYSQLRQGVAQGANPRETARLTMKRVSAIGETLDGGLARALNIGRTETLDAYRESAMMSQLANTDVLDGWIWTAKLGARTCAGCWGMNGQEFPNDAPGPQDHQQGRCARVPKTKSWEELGISGIEPTGAKVADSGAAFDRLTEVQQTAILGPGRFAAWKEGKFPINQWAIRTNNPGWRQSYTARPLSKIGHPGAPGPKPKPVSELDRHRAELDALKARIAKGGIEPGELSKLRGRQGYLQSRINKLSGTPPRPKTPPRPPRPRKTPPKPETLSTAEAVEIYANDQQLYYELNKALRAGKELTAKQKAVADALEKAATPLDRDMVLYRATGETTWTPGAEYKTLGFTSTTKSAEVGDDFLDIMRTILKGEKDETPTLLRIQARKGARALDMNKHGADKWMDQDEILFPPGTEIRVVSSRIQGGVRYVDIEVGPKPPTPPKLSIQGQIEELKKRIASEGARARKTTNPAVKNAASANVRRMQIELRQLQTRPVTRPPTPPRPPKPTTPTAPKTYANPLDNPKIQDEIAKRKAEIKQIDAKLTHPTKAPDLQELEVLMDRRSQLYDQIGDLAKGKIPKELFPHRKNIQPIIDTRDLGKLAKAVKERETELAKLNAKMKATHLELDDYMEHANERDRIKREIDQLTHQVNMAEWSARGRTYYWTDPMLDKRSKEAIEEAFRLMEVDLGIPIPTGVRVERLATGTANGNFSTFTRTIRLRNKAEAKNKDAIHEINTTVHELGHMLDNLHRYGSSRESYRSAVRGTREWDAWWDAIQGSHTAKMIARRGDDWGAYASTPHEFWARSFAQWAAIRGKSPSALAELRRVQGSLYSASVWSDAEFEPIAKAIDQIVKGFKKK